MVATVNKPFLALTAADLMSRNVIMIPREMSLRGAAHVLSQASVSGAPVIDEEGRCVGVVSATDFMRWMEEAPLLPESGPGCMQAPCVCSDWQVVDIEGLPLEEVGEYMTADPVMVTSHARIAELARLMLDGHIHRLIVVDTEYRPIGIVSSTDILAAVAYADQRS